MIEKSPSTLLQENRELRKLLKRIMNFDDISALVRDEIRSLFEKQDRRSQNAPGFNAEARRKGVEAVRRRAAEARAELQPIVLDLRRKNLSLRAIAEELNARGIKTPNGKTWGAGNVKNLLPANEDNTDNLM